MPSVYIAALVANILSILIIGILILKISKRVLPILVVFGLVSIPGSYFAFNFIRIPLDNLIKQVFLFSSLKQLPLWYFLIVLLYAPITEELMKLTPLIIPYFRNKITKDNKIAAGMIIGLGFGIGEMWLIAYWLSRDPSIINYHWYQLDGYIFERLVSCFSHGFFTAVAITGFGNKFIKYILWAMGLHTLSNLPVVLFSAGVIKLNFTTFQNVMVIYLLLFVLGIAFILIKLLRKDRGKGPFRRVPVIIFFLFSLALACPIKAYSVSADVIDISDRKYFDSVHNCLKNAKNSLYVSMFLIIANERDKISLPYILFQDLIEAQNRGVRVVVRLNRSQENEYIYMKLSSAGIDCKFTLPNKTLHDKLIIIDEETVIEGSMNWFTRALKQNRESASLIKSKAYAKEKIKRIEGLEITGQANLDRAQVETVAIRNKFLRDPNFGAKLVHNKNERGFDLYLLFLKDFQESGQAKFELDYEKMAKSLGIDLTYKNTYRDEINRVLKRLRDKYKLIGCKFTAGKPAQITLLDYEDNSKEYQVHQNQYFKVPKAYWEYGWSRKLDLKTKYCYLISVYRTEFSEIKPWWSLPLDLLAEDFHLGKWTIMRGMRNLKKLGLLDVEYDAALNEEGRFSGREPNKYRLKPLLSQEEIDKNWAELNSVYAEGPVKKAIEFAFLIDEGNNTDKVRSFIQIIGQYGEERVERATKLTARMRPDNPSRNFGYIVGILKNWEKEGF